jgi:hypothetical protein
LLGGRGFVALDDLAGTANIEDEWVVAHCSVGLRVHAVRGASSVKALEADVETVWVVLVAIHMSVPTYKAGYVLSGSGGLSSRKSGRILTIESKHCVQSSRYTD